MKVGTRKILYTYSCAQSPGKAHFHASHVTRTKVGTTSHGTGRCFTLPAALIWLTTGLAGKPRHG